MFAVASVHSAELAALETQGLLADLGLTRERFLAVASDCFADAMADMRARGRGHPLDDEQVDRELARTGDPRSRALAWRATVAPLPADGRLRPGELALLQRMLDAWHMPPATLEGALAPGQAPAIAGVQQ